MPLFAHAATFGSVAEAGIKVADFAGGFLSYVCYIAGVCLWFGALIQYKQHRQNPLQVRLSQPIFYLVLGAVIFAVPFAHLLAK